MSVLKNHGQDCLEIMDVGHGSNDFRFHVGY